MSPQKDLSPAISPRKRRWPGTRSPRMSAREKGLRGGEAPHSDVATRAAPRRPAQDFWPSAAFHHHGGPRTCTWAAAWSPVVDGCVNRRLGCCSPPSHKRRLQSATPKRSGMARSVPQFWRPGTSPIRVKTQPPPSFPPGEAERRNDGGGTLQGAAAVDDDLDARRVGEMRSAGDDGACAVLRRGGAVPCRVAGASSKASRPVATRTSSRSSSTTEMTKRQA